MNLEDRFFYRLIKVLFNFLIILATVILLILSNTFVPEKTINNEKSYITCVSNNKNYSLVVVGVKFAPYENELDTENHNIAKRFCFYRNMKPVTDPKVLTELNRKNGDDLFDTKKYDLTSIIADDNYRLKIIYNSRTWGDLSFPITFFIIAVLFFYILINIVRESLIYIIFGRKFIWYWLFPFKRKNIK